MFNQNLLIFTQYLIIGLPFALISGAFLSDLIVILINLLFIYFLIAYKDFKFINNKYFYFLLIFWFLFSIRSLFADDILLSFKSSFFFIRIILLSFAVYYFLTISKDNFFKKYYKILLILIIFFSFDLIFQYFVGYNIFGFTIDNPDKINGMFGDEAVAGSYLLRLFPLILISGIFTNMKNKNIVFLFLSLLILFSIFISGSRSSIFLSFLFILLVAISSRVLKKYVLISSLCLIIILGSFSLFSKETRHSLYYNIADPIKSMFLPNKETLQSYNLPQRKFVIFTPIYQSHYESALLMFKDNIFFGHGTKMFRKKCQLNKYKINHVSCTSHPHNFYIQFLAENGVIGFIFISLIFLYLIKEYVINVFSKQKKNKNFNEILLLSGLICSFFPITPSGNFFNNWLSISIFYPFGFYLFYKYSKK